MDKPRDSSNDDRIKTRLANEFVEKLRKEIPSDRNNGLDYLIKLLQSGASGFRLGARLRYAYNYSNDDIQNRIEAAEKELAEAKRLLREQR